MSIKAVIWLRVIALSGLIAGGTTTYFVVTSSPPGVVTWILFTIENSMALVDGQSVYEGDTINCVEVVKIEQSTVEFEMDGKRWKQNVRQRPNLAWSECNKHKRK